MLSLNLLPMAEGRRAHHTAFTKGEVISSMEQVHINGDFLAARLAFLGTSEHTSDNLKVTGHPRTSGQCSPSAAPSSQAEF